MIFYKSWIIIFLMMIISQLSVAQGPPITSDKPIMLGKGSTVVKTLTEIRRTEIGTFTKIPLMVHYLPTSNSLVGLYLPFVAYNFEQNDQLGTSQTLGDIELLAKYQFYRKDETGKTFRMVAKTVQTLPTGEALNIEGMSTGQYQSYLSLVAGYESIKYGISNELGYNFVPNGELNELRYKLGFGLPLLKPTYPVNQINLYFEYQNSWFTTNKDFMMLYAQGIQYAKGRLTVETAIQMPLMQTLPEATQRKYSLYLGTRYVF